MRSIVFVLLMVFLSRTATALQKDTSLNRKTDSSRLGDTAIITETQLQADTLPISVRMPDSLRHDQFIDTLLKRYAFDPYNFRSTNRRQLGTGRERTAREGWIIAVIMFLFVYTAVLNRLLGKDILNVIEAFYVRRSLAKLTREDNLLTSWAYICLFVLFGLTMGLYGYHIALYYHTVYTIGGFQLFFVIAMFVIAAFIAKILIVRIIGFVFDIKRLTGEYISILYLTYFNTAFIFLPVVVCFSLLPSNLTYSLLVFSVILISVVFLIQYARSAINIISEFTFPKIYLFVYLCALEICPVLILMKALNL